MGSMGDAVITGFLCRLCSRINKKVVHLFGLEHIALVKKIAVTVEIRIQPNDDLPKTICTNCIAAVETNYNFIRMVRRNFKMMSRARKRNRNGRPIRKETDKKKDKAKPAIN